MLQTINFLSAFFGCAVCISLIWRTQIAKYVMDSPNHRSLHKSPVSRIGGTGVFVGLCLSAFIQATLQTTFAAPTLQPVTIFTVLGYISLYVLSIIDDAKPLNAALRMAIHLAVALVWSIHALNLGNPLYIFLITLVIAWGANLFNFMDGADGLAGGMTFIGFFAYAIAALLTDNASLAFISISMCGAVLAFLIFNWPPAKVFLGDSGSIPIGFLAASIGASGVTSGAWHPLFPIMLFAMFWMDATVTLATRVFRQEKIWQAHKSHWYQKAIRSGASHKKVLYVHLLCNVIISTLSLTWLLIPAFSITSLQVFTITGVFVIPIFFGFWAERRFRRAKGAPSVEHSTI